MTASPMQKKQHNALLTILWLGFLTGTLDGIAALIWNGISSGNINAAVVFKFIASAVFGPAAFKGGAEMVVAGIVFHYIIALVFSMVYYLLYPAFDKFLRSKYQVAVFYGIITWLVMNLAVVPLSKIGYHHITAKAATIGLIILIICIGLPIALITDKKYEESKPVEAA